MNVYCVKDGNEMVPQNNNEFVCLKCEFRVRVEKGYSVAMFCDTPEGAPEYNDV
ncbi:hypothetical protein LCGC14_0586070 [marine sediment metagenome]|uniref:Uncharacterized protein n=1 Tax=marine sediment metagenome TaxID=412755 RepID=A0A0F9U0X6_9ZZZZ